MNAQRTRRRRPVLAVALAAWVALIAMPQSAAAQEAPVFAVTFVDLVPGVPQTQSAAITIAESAWFQELTWIERTGILEDATMTVRICDPSGACVDGANPAGSPRFPAGSLTVDVTAMLPADAPQDEAGSAVGRLTFGNEDVLPPPPASSTTTIPARGSTTTIAGGSGSGSGGLGPTGAESLSIALWATAAVAVGATMVVVARHRRAQGDDS